MKRDRLVILRIPEEKDIRKQKYLAWSQPGREEKQA